jgi:osmotically-inducible protein OsmY
VRSDSDIKRDVEDELWWDPDIDPTDIAVSVNSGIVTLTGLTRSYMQKYQAETDAKRVAGVLRWSTISKFACLASTRAPKSHATPSHKIKGELRYSWEEIRVVVKKGWLTLEGDVDACAGSRV